MDKNRPEDISRVGFSHFERLRNAYAVSVMGKVGEAKRAAKSANACGATTALISSPV
jgi:hypothetical protein